MQGRAVHGSPFAYGNPSLVVMSLHNPPTRAAPFLLMTWAVDLLGVWGIIGCATVAPMIISLWFMSTAKDESEQRGWAAAILFMFAYMIGLAWVMIIR